MGRTPGVDVVAPGVGARLDGDELVRALIVGQAAAHAGEVGVERGGVVVALVGVAARGVGLPDLDQLATHRAAVAVQHPAGDPDPLAERLAPVPAGQVVVEGGDIGDAEDRAGEFHGLGVVQGDQRLAGVAQDAAAVRGVAAVGMAPPGSAGGHGLGVGLAPLGYLLGDPSLGQRGGHTVFPTFPGPGRGPVRRRCTGRRGRFRSPLRRVGGRRLRRYGHRRRRAGGRWRWLRRAG